MEQRKPAARESAGPNPPQILPIRTAATTEAALLSRFMARIFLEAFGQAGERERMLAHLRSQFSAAAQSAELAAPDWITLVVGNAGDYAGVAQLALTALPPPELAARRPAELHRFQIDRSHQGSELAAELMRETKRHAAGRGADVLWLAVWQQSARAIRFFRRQGFAVVGSQDLPIGGEHRAAWVMACPVEP